MFRHKNKAHNTHNTDEYHDENSDFESSDSDDDSLSPPLTTTKDYTQSDLDLHRMYVRHVRVPSNILIIGPKHAGKTTLLKHILLNFHENVFSESCVVTSDPKEYQEVGLDEDIWNVTTAYDMEHSLDNYSVRIVEDISVHSPEDHDIFKLYENNRKLNIIANDDYVKLSSNTKKSIDYIILLGNIRKLREVWFDHVGLVKHYSDFKLIYDDCTQNYDFLIIDNFGSSNKVEDHVKWGRIDDIKDLHRVRYPSNEYRKKQTKTSIERTQTPYRKKHHDVEHEYSSLEKLLLDESDESDVEDSQNSQVTDITDSIQRSVVINKSHIAEEKILPLHSSSSQQRTRFSSHQPQGTATNATNDIRRYSIRDLKAEKPQSAKPVVFKSPQLEEQKEIELPETLEPTQSENQVGSFETPEIREKLESSTQRDIELPQKETENPDEECILL